MRIILFTFSVSVMAEPNTVLSCADGSVYATFFSTDVGRYGERSFVRRVGANLYLRWQEGHASGEL